MIFDVVDCFDIIAGMARDGYLEEVAGALGVRHDDRADLCEETYLILLAYDCAKIAAIWDRGEMRYFVSGVMRNQYYSRTSAFYRQYKRFRARATGIEDAERNGR